MDGFVWLVVSWVFVGLLSYLFVTRFNIGVQNTQTLRRVSGGALPSVDNQIGKVEWINEFITWLASHHNFPIGLSQHWLNALNDVAKKICNPTENEVLFERIEQVVSSSCPKLSEIQSFQNSNGQLVLKSYAEVPSVKVRIVASENMDNYVTVNNYQTTITNLGGDIEARLAYVADELYLMCCFNCRPEMNVTLSNADKPNITVNSPKLDSIIRKCVTSAVVSVNLHEYVLSLRDPADEIRPEDSFVQPLQDNSMALFGQTKHSANVPAHQFPNRVKIKLVNAQRLNTEGNPALRSYATAEIDEPSQRFSTMAIASLNPQWNETADFIINETSDEVLFEVYGVNDRGAKIGENIFLGLAIAGLGEMRRSTNRIHELHLQSRPYQNDRVSGMLTIQFKPPENITNEVWRSPTTNSTAYTTTEKVSPTGVDFTELVDRPHKDPVFQSTSRQLSKYESAEENEPARWTDVETTQLISSADRRGMRKERGKRERSFFGELRDRLTGGHSRAKKRAKSLDAQNPFLEEATSLPPSRDQSQVRYERLSRADTVERSTRSGNRSPVTDRIDPAPTTKSQLVLELIEPKQGLKYYYLIPDEYAHSVSASTDIVKRGKKLHIHNDHMFVAVKAKGRVICDVCGSRISTNFIKQAYQCRDCRLVTHKSCHQRTRSPCPSSTLDQKTM
ncbi:Protein kinase C-like 3 [Aphelenchoides besseyi]|nr:Protein kinase C-like 3 [Aphelenchoides besseyi]